MKKTAHELKLDGRKSKLNQLKDNGLSEVMKENRTENSGLVKIKQSAIKKLKRKISETTDHEEIEKMKSEIEKKENQIKKYLNK